MNPFHALVLGIVQGLSEFLPISSSAHLTLIPQLIGWPEQPLVFDTTLHLGTAAALILFFWKDLVRVYSAFVRDALTKMFKFSEYSREGKFAFYLLLSTVPATIVGALVGEKIEKAFGTIIGVVVTLIFGTILMYIAEKYFSKNTTGDLQQKMNSKKSLIIGSFQTLAIFPGVSRSGSTITSGMYMGLSREEAARFSFLASVPIILEAGIFQLVKHPEQLHGAGLLPVLIGFVTSFIVGMLVVKFLLGYLKNKSLNVFIWYRVALTAGLILVLLFVR